MVAFGCRSGLLIMPLMYLASISTTRLVTPKMNTWTAQREQNSLYSSSLAWEYWLSMLVRLIESKRFG